MGETAAVGWVPSVGVGVSRVWRGRPPSAGPFFGLGPTKERAFASKGHSRRGASPARSVLRVCLAAVGRCCFLPDLPPAPVSPAGASRGARGLRPWELPPPEQAPPPLIFGCFRCLFSGQFRPAFFGGAKPAAFPLSGFRQGSSRARRRRGLDLAGFFASGGLDIQSVLRYFYLARPVPLPFGGHPFLLVMAFTSRVSMDGMKVRSKDRAFFCSFAAAAAKSRL